MPRHHNELPTEPARDKSLVFTEDEVDIPEKRATASDIASVGKAGPAALTDAIRHSILTKRFVPPHNWKPPARQFGNRTRRTPAFFFDKDKYSSISYSPQEDGAYCADCVAFSKVKVILVSKPLSHWSNAKKQVDSHFASKDHLTAVSRAREFLNVCNKEQDSVSGQLSKAYQDSVDQNRAALTAIIRTIILCGRQNLALRGHQEDHGNFLSFPKYRAETDQALANHLDRAPKNATYLSPSVQNELIELCGQQISDHIIEECKAECKAAGMYTCRSQADCHCFQID